MEILTPSRIRVNPRSLAINEHSDFTRRIPALPQKQLARDGKIAKQIIRAYDEGNDARKAKDIFFRKAKLLSNPRYWEVLRSVWVVAGTTENVEEFLPYFKSTRPCKGWFMTVEDAEALEKMSFPITVYRAYSQDKDPGISWTLDLEWCKGYAQARGCKVKSRTVERKDVFAYISRRGEEEFIILQYGNERRTTPAYRGTGKAQANTM